MQSNRIYKLFFYNIILLFTFSGLGLIALEFYLKSKNPFSLFPAELSKKKSITVNNKRFNFFDAKADILVKELKTDVYYKHNSLGHRVNKFENNKESLSSKEIKKNLIGFGDSTSYGLNIQNEDTFIQQVSNYIKFAGVKNFSYPGINLDGLSYKIDCASNILLKNNTKSKLAIVSIYFNDLEDLNDLLIWDANSCQEIININLIYAKTKGKIFNNQSNNKKNRKRKYNLNKILNFDKYSTYLYSLVCDDFLPRSCDMAKFSISNIHPRFRSIIFGSNRANNLYSDLNKDEIIKMKNSIKLFENALNKLSYSTERLILFYIPRDEMDIINMINNDKRERVFNLFKYLCDKNSRENIYCLDGTEVIHDSLDLDVKRNLINSGRLPDNYYSYLPMFDMGHPSKYLSKIYADAIRDLYLKK